MKSKVESMDEQIKNLVSNMEELSMSSKSIGEALAPNRSKIIKLSGIRQLLTNLNFLFNLPERLKSSINVKAYAQAVKDYKVSSSYLRRHGHIDSFKRIQAETSYLIKNLKTSLMITIQDPSSEILQQFDYAQLLLDLDEAPETLYNVILSSRLKSFLNVINDLRTNSRESESKSDDVSFMANCKSIMGTFVELVSQFRDIFVKSLAKKASVASEKAEKELQKFGKQVVDTFLQKAKEYLIDFSSLRCEIVSVVSLRKETEKLASFLEQFSSLVNQICTVVNDAEVLKTLDSITDSVVSTFVSQALEILHMLQLERLDQLVDVCEETFGFPRARDAIYNDEIRLLSLMITRLSDLSGTVVDKIVDDCGSSIVSLIRDVLQCFRTLLPFQDIGQSRRLAFIKSIYLLTEQHISNLISDLLFGSGLLTSSTGTLVYKGYNDSSFESKFFARASRIDGMRRQRAQLLASQVHSYSAVSVSLLVSMKLSTYMFEKGVQAVYTELGQSFPSRFSVSDFLIRFSPF
jgi:hypothetical protein